MNRGRQSFSGCGGCTGENVLLNKNIRKNADGAKDVLDYFTDTSEESENTSGSHLWIAHKDKDNGEKLGQLVNIRKPNNSHESPELKRKGKRSSAGKKIEAAAICRRSGRHRIPPLEKRRNERAHYRIDGKGLTHFIDIVPGNKEDDGSKTTLSAKLFKQEQNRQNQIEASKKRHVSPPRIEINDMILKKNVALPLLKKFDYIPWNGEPNDPYAIKSVIQTSNSKFGFIEIKAGKSKPLQNLPNEDLYLCVMEGNLKAFIGEREILLGKKDTLMVPRSVPYILTNDGARKALLVFSVVLYE